METNIKMNQEEIIKFLLEDIKKLKYRIDFLEKQKSITSSIVLEKIWNNEYDTIWDEI